MNAIDEMRSEIAWLHALHAKCPRHLRNDIAADIADLEQAIAVLQRAERTCCISATPAVA